MKSFYESLQENPLLKDEVFKPLFEFFRNIAVVALFVGGGFYWLKHPSNDPVWLQQASVLLLIFGGMFLFVLNMMYGLKKLGEAGVPSKLLLLLGILAFLPLVGVFTGLMQGK